MTARRSLVGLVVALAVVATACSSDGFDAGLEGSDEEPTPTVTEDPTPTPEPIEGDLVPILSGTVGDLVDRIDLTQTVGDLEDPRPATVPDVVGLEVTEAARVLDDAGFVPYLADTFPPTGDVDRVVDSWPDGGQAFVTGANVFLELDGPMEAVLVAPGDELTGVVNGVQVTAFDRFDNWLLRVWLDASVGIETGGDPITIGREIELRVPPDDVVCVSGAPFDNPSALPPGGAITFMLADASAGDLRFAFPERLTAADIELTCS